MFLFRYGLYGTIRIIRVQIFQIEQPFGKLYGDEFPSLVYAYDKFLLGGNQQFLTVFLDYEKGIDGSGIHLHHLAQKSVTSVLHAETDEEVPGQFTVSGFFRILHREIDFDIGKRPGTFGGIDPLQLHQSGGVGTETVLFDEKGYKNSVEQADQIVAVHTVKNIIRKGKLQLTVNSVRLIEQSYFIYFFFLYHIRVILAPMAFRRPSMF